MALTPSDVEEKTFGTALRGYDLDEVDDFLDEVVATIRELHDQVAEARAAEPAEQPESPPAPADESAIGRALIAAQNAADGLLAQAKEEADRIVDDAKGDAETWTAERDAKKAAAEQEMAELKDHVSNIRTQLAVLATAVADRLDEMDQTIDAESASEETDGHEGDSYESTSSADEESDPAADEDDTDPESVRGEF